MTSSHLIDAEQLLADQLAQASPDLLRGLLSTFIRLVGAVLAEQHDEWIEGRRYLSLEVLTRARAALTSTEEPAKQQTTNTPALTT
ncbi:transposase [Mycobacterium tuberculosis]|nr:transposase [Mycobacterium tuberculosis]